LLAEVNCNYYQVTVDGLASTHDKRRCHADGSGSWEAIINNLLAAKESPHSFTMTIRTNFDEEVATSAVEFYTYIKEKFDDPRFQVFFISIKKWGGNNNLEILKGTDMINTSVKFSNIISDLGLKNGMFDSFTYPFQGICHACKHNTFVIDYDGVVRKCTLILDDDVNNVGMLESNGVFNINHIKQHAGQGMLIQPFKNCDCNGKNNCGC